MNAAYAGAVKNKFFFIYILQWRRQWMLVVLPLLQPCCCCCASCVTNSQQRAAINIKCYLLFLFVARVSAWKRRIKLVPLACTAHTHIRRERTVYYSVHKRHTGTWSRSGWVAKEDEKNGNKNKRVAHVNVTNLFYARSRWMCVVRQIVYSLHLHTEVEWEWEHENVACRMCYFVTGCLLDFWSA